MGIATRMHDAKEPLSGALAGPYGHPFHPMLVTIPIGAWMCSLVFDVGSRIVDEPGFLTRGSQWLIGIGVVGALAAATIGFLDLAVIPSDTAAFRTALVHMALNLAVTAAYAFNFIWRGDAYRYGVAVGLGPLALSVLSVAGLAVAGYLGGKLAYRYGVRVATEADQAHGFEKLANSHR